MSRMTYRIQLLASTAAAVVAGVVAGSVIVQAHPSVAEQPNEAMNRPDPAAPQYVEGESPSRAGTDRWAVRLYRSEEGRDCLMVGELAGGRFGRTVRGQFVPAPPDVPGDTCANWDHAPLGVAVALHQRGAGYGEAVDRSVLYGLADASVASITTIDDDGTQREAAIGPRRTFVLAFDGKRDLSDMTVRVAYRDGSTADLPRAPKSPN